MKYGETRRQSSRYSKMRGGRTGLAEEACKAELRSGDERTVSMTSHLIGAETSDGNQNLRPADQPTKPSLHHSLREDTVSAWDFMLTPF